MQKWTEIGYVGGVNKTELKGYTNRQVYSMYNFFALSSMSAPSGS